MKLIKYFFVGGAAAFVDISLFALFAKLLQFNYLIVGSLGFILATLINYRLSICYVFNSGIRFDKKQELLAVYTVSALGLLMHQLALYTAVQILNMELMVSKINATGLVFLWNFSIRNFFVFAVKKEVK
jgi:putative flippase GtrA